MEIIKVEGLVKDYGKFRALSGVNLTVEKGEVYGFIGPNGAGKTTTIRVLLGILKATEGTSKLFGRDSWDDAEELHKRLAYVPGDVNLWPNLSGGEVIDLFIRMRGAFDKGKRDELVERFDLDPTKKCRAYSKGNRQKVALISAFASNAELFILDEPTSGLDPLMDKIFTDYVEEVRSRGCTVLLSSHILSEVERLCSKVSIIRQGRIIDSGALSDMRHLSFNRIKVQTKTPPEIDATSVHNLKIMDEGSAESAGRTMSFSLEAENIGGMVAHLNQYGIEKLEITPPSLQELFMSHYEGAESDD